MDLANIAAILLTQLARGAAASFGPLSRAFVAALWSAYKSKLVLGVAIFAFSGTGMVMIIWSHGVAGWNQAALLGFGTSLPITGTVELGILGVLNKIISPDPTNDLYSLLSKRFDELQIHLGVSAIPQAESGSRTTARWRAAGRCSNRTAARPAVAGQQHLPCLAATTEEISRRTPPASAARPISAYCQTGPGN